MKISTSTPVDLLRKIHSLNFIDLGLALGQVRDRRLYRDEHKSFEQYCRQKLGYSRRYAEDLITAARLAAGLATSARQPDHESQLRPLAHLPLSKAREIWDKAVERAGAGRITARLVRSAGASRPARVKPSRRKHKPQPLARNLKPSQASRARIESTIGELLVLLGRNASHSTMTEKLEMLYNDLQTVFDAR